MPPVDSPAAGAPSRGAAGGDPETAALRADAAAPDARTRRRRRRRALPVLLVLTAVVLGLVAWAGWAALRAQEHLEAVRDDALALREEPPADPAALEARLAAAHDRAGEAVALLDQPGPRLVAAVPVLGRSLAAERAVARAGEALLASAVPVVRAADGLTAGGGVDLARLDVLSQRLAAAAERAGPALDELAAVDTGLTPAAVADALAEARAVLLGADDLLADAAAGVDALEGVLGAEGPRRVLVALENNAELRGRAGLVAVFATGTTTDGRLELDAFREVIDVSDEPGEVTRVAAPPEVAEHYGRYLADTTMWKQSTMAADGPASAATLAAVAEASLGEAPDVVLLVDVPAIAAVVSATGPVVLPDGREVDGQGLVDALLVDAYEEAGETRAAQTARRGRLVALAAGAAARLLGGDGLEASPDLVRALATSAAGRHLAVWSARPEEQAALERAGLAGSVDPHGDDLAMVTVNNLPGNKIDYYVERSLAVDVALGPERAAVTQTVRFRNDAPEGLPPYVAGPDRSARWVSLLDLAASPTATDLVLSVDGQPVAADVRTETGSTRVVTTAALDRGEEVTLVLRYTVPVVDGSYALRAVPQPLARDAVLDLRVRPVDGAVLGPVEGAERRGGTGGPLGHGGEVAESGEFDRVRRVAVALDRPDTAERLERRVARWLSEPVSLG